MEALKELLNGFLWGPRSTDCSDVLETNLRIESKIDNLKQ